MGNESQSLLDFFFGTEQEPAQEIKQPAPMITEPETVAHIEKHRHTKRRFDMYMVVMRDRVTREEYLDLLHEAKKLDGWWSRQWEGTPGGFAFRKEAAALEFLSKIEPHEIPAPIVEQLPEKVSRPANPHAEKLRSLADNMQSKIDHKLADRLTNTPRRLKQAQGARIEGEQLQRTQTALLKLAELHDAGEVPEVLKDIRSINAVYSLLRTRKTGVSNGFHSYHACTGEPDNTSPEALALWELIGTKREGQKQADKLRERLDALKFSKIPGYFPTPKNVIDTMMEYAELKQGHVVLEPSAGHGAIADAIEPHCEGVKCIEKNWSLFDILELKGYNTEQGDFMEYSGKEKYDRVLMNPPFENGQEIDHIRKAYSHLKPGGRLVSVMSSGPFYRSDKKATEFREWIEGMTTEVIDLPENAFKESGTGVRTKLVVIDREYTE
ncbi:MAG: methyltransferase [Gammaproteobacteria bacterium]|nr:methyltransferase [Gammaproteobacteria bacterium]